MKLPTEKDVLEYLNNACEEGTDQTSPCINPKEKVGEHPAFSNMANLYQFACCPHHFGVYMWLAGFMHGQKYDQRKADLKELESCYGTDTGTDRVR